MTAPTIPAPAQPLYLCDDCALIDFPETAVELTQDPGHRTSNPDCDQCRIHGITKPAQFIVAKPNQ